MRSIMLKATKTWLVLLLVSLVYTGLVYADEHDDAIQVTLNVNTATVPDTLSVNDVVQVRGQIVGHDWENEEYLGQVIRWNDQSDIVADNLGGDYWQATVNVMPGDTLEYKFWVGYSLDPEVDAAGGWEGGDNRMLPIPEEQDEAIEVDLAFWDRSESIFDAEDDRIGVHFSVNVGRSVQDDIFDPEDDAVQVRGNRSPLEWNENTEVVLEEVETGDANVFFKGIAYFEEEDLEWEGDEEDPYQLLYKFHLGTEGDGGWEDGANREAHLSSLSDTTLHWVFYNDEPLRDEEAETVATEVQFGVNVGILEALGFFVEDGDAADVMQVRGNVRDFTTWGDDARELEFDGIEAWFGTYSPSTQLIVGEVFEYKYYIDFDPDIDRGDTDADDLHPWEEPGDNGGANRLFNVQNVSSQHVWPEGDNFHYFNGVSPAAFINSQLIEGEPDIYPVTFQVDMNPAMEGGDQIDPNQADYFEPDQHDLIITFQEQILPFTQGISRAEDRPVGDEFDRVQFHDENGDGVYELTLDLELPAPNVFGYNFAYGDFDDEDSQIFQSGGGEGDEPNRYTYQYITPVDVELIDDTYVSTWPEEAVLQPLEFRGGRELGGDLPVVETAPDYRAIATSADSERVAERPAQVELRQNYPNPFNPSTNIEFSLPAAQDVTLEVYNVLGQRVAKLIDRQVQSGSHTVQFDAGNLSSGVYIYQLRAGDVVRQKQMTFVK